MAKYSYTARTVKEGQEAKGVLEAKDARHASQLLKEEGLILVKAEILKDKSEETKFSLSLPFFGVSLEERMMFTRNLQVMISAGLPLPRAMETLSLQAQNKKFKTALLRIKDDIIKGKNFSDSLEAFPDIFSELFRNMVKVGEEAGTLEQTLKVLTRQIEREHELKAKIMGALMYPAVIILAMAGIGILMLVMVVPKLAATFEELNIELPITTKIVISAGMFMAGNWLLSILGAIFSAAAFMMLMKTKAFKSAMDIFSLRIPVISPIIKKTNLAFTVRTLSSLIASGVPIVRALEITSNTLGNTHYKKSILEAMEKVRKGEKLSSSFASHGNLYPPLVVQMIQVGEETGETAKLLDKLAEFFEDEVGNATRNLTSLVEPVLMLFVGVVVGFFAISMIQPMYSMLGSV